VQLVMKFEEYLAGKKIDAALFRQGEPLRWRDFEEIFGQMHPESFTAQKKFLLNDLRRRYLLKTPEPVKAAEETGDPAPVTEPKAPARPVVRRPAAVIRKPPEEN
jgi:hypothetical protein